MLNRRIFRPAIEPKPPQSLHLRLESDFNDTPDDRRQWAKYLLSLAASSENKGSALTAISNDLARALARMLDSSADEMERVS